MSRLIHSVYLKVGTKVYSGLVSDVNMPGLEATVWDGSTDTNVVADVPVGQRKLVITARQDWADETGLCETLRSGEGSSAEVIYSHNPDPAVGPWWKVTVPCLVAPAQGGKLNGYGEFTLNLPCTKPERLDALPA
jgi:hypothetical protein